MELQIYYRILVRRWWILALIFATTLSAGAFWTSRLANIYEAKTTFVIRPRAELIVNNDFVRALDIVSRRVEINTTFAEVVNSKTIMNSAADSLNLTSKQRGALVSVKGRVVGGTNVLEISVQGTDPQIVKTFANAVSSEVLKYISNLYDIFDLEPLDPAEVPTRPIRPNRTFNLLMSSLLGLFLGVSVIFLVEYVSIPHRGVSGIFNIIDEETGAFNKPYFVLRLSQEIKRSQHHISPITLGLIQIKYDDSELDNSFKSRSEALRIARIIIDETLREEDLLFRFDEDVFAVVAPEIRSDEAKKLMDLLKVNLDAYQTTTFGKGEKSKLMSCIGAFYYYDQHFEQDELVKRTLHALELARSSPLENVVFMSINHDSLHAFRPTESKSRREAPL